MKILVLQLARFGDIFQTWPVVRALRRRHPEAEVHMLVRERFQSALMGLESVTVHALPTAQVLQSILESPVQTVSEEALASALMELRKFIEPIENLRFTKIVNLSFSPLSSYLVDWVSCKESLVSGYCRHNDGHLHIPDDTSAYFYSQVGIDRFNRYHLVDIFAGVAGVELIESDFNPDSSTSKSGIVIQLGASQAEKVYPAELWVALIFELLQNTDRKIIIVGSENERAMSDTVVAQVNQQLDATLRIENKVGQTEWPTVFGILKQAELLIAADSAPIHVASLVGTPVLNLSCRAVRFWETGPRSSGSRVLSADDMASLSPFMIADEACRILAGEGVGSAQIWRDSLLDSFQTKGKRGDDFQWSLIQALYSGEDFPELETDVDRTTMHRTFEVAELALSQLSRWEDVKQRDSALQILARVDELLVDLQQLSERIAPLFWWFEAQRIRIAPGTVEQVQQQTKKAFEELLWVTAVYRAFGRNHEVRDQALSLATKCIENLREFELEKVQPEFFSLVSHLQELSRHSTNVGGRPWSEVLTELVSAMERRDLIEAADQIETLRQDLLPL